VPEWKALRRDFESRDDLATYLRQQFPDAAGDLSPVQGGALTAWKTLSSYKSTRYAATRNFLSGSVSHLSMYVRHGVITLRDVLNHVQPIYKFVQELAWRDYWQRLYYELGNGIWIDREEWKTGLSADDYADELPADIANGETGLACMDNFSHILVLDGYLHNHARMWMASYIVHWRRVKWQAGARWFLTHLLDGDPASNNLSWQWVASTFSHKPYIFDRGNLERYTEGAFCGNCSRRQTCPFERSYEREISSLAP
jgi:deoxyribodipyrimidine photo-lyase